MASFRFPTTGYYKNEDIKWCVVVTENYTEAAGARLHIEVNTYDVNSLNVTTSYGVFNVLDSSTNEILYTKDYSGTSRPVNDYIPVPKSWYAEGSGALGFELKLYREYHQYISGCVVYLTKYTAKYHTSSDTSKTYRSDTGYYGEVKTITSAVPTKIGYDFLGWTDVANGTKAKYVADDTYTMKVNMLFYAVWSLKTYKISYDANGGSRAPSPQTKTHAINLTLRNISPERTGYTFLGWNTSKTATTVVYVPGSKFTDNADRTLYAVWKINTYTVSYDGNGGYPVPASQTKTHGVPLTLSSTIPVRTGYTFLGWSTVKTAISAPYTAGGNFGLDANTTLYAVWEAKEYTLVYNSNDRTGRQETDTATYGKSYTYKDSIFERAGYEFLGWSLNPFDTVPMYKAGHSFTYTDTSGHTYYAIWKAKANCYIKQNGAYVHAMMYVKQNGEYKQCTVNVKKDGTYKASTVT